MWYYSIKGKGDSLSPYLFLLCVEGLSSMLRAVEVNGSLHGLSICLRGPNLSPIFFADKSLMQWHYVRRIAQIWKISFNFSKNCDDGAKEALKSFLGINLAWEDDKYLVLPLVMGKSKNKVFQDIKERIWKRIQGWKGCLIVQQKVA